MLERLLLLLLDKASGIGKRAFNVYMDKFERMNETPEQAAVRRECESMEHISKQRYESAKRAWRAGSAYYRTITLGAAGVPRADIEVLSVRKWQDLDPGLRARIMEMEPR